MYRAVVAVDRLVCGIYTTISAEAVERGVQAGARLGRYFHAGGRRAV